MRKFVVKTAEAPWDDVMDHELVRERADPQVTAADGTVLLRIDLWDGSKLIVQIDAESFFAASDQLRDALTRPEHWAGVPTDGVF